MKSFTRWSQVVMVVIACFALAGKDACADVIVLPVAQTATEGDANNSFPFAGTGSMRYQQVYGATDFLLFLPGPQSITQLAFRANGGVGAFSVNIPSIRIDLSTTPFGPDTLSPTFATNVGPNNTTVFNGALNMATSGNNSGAGGTEPFDLVIPLSTPFLYNPAAGNLLLDVRNFSGNGGFGSFDAQNTTGDSVSRVFAGGANSTMGTPGTLGLVTQFTTTAVTPVPEPSTYAMMGIGLIGLIVVQRRKKAIA